MDYESLSELAGKKLRLNFAILEGENLPTKLCTKTYCEYEFYYMKDPKAKKVEDGDNSNDSDSDDRDNIGDDPNE